MKAKRGEIIKARIKEGKIILKGAIKG